MLCMLCGSAHSAQASERFVHVATDYKVASDSFRCKDWYERAGPRVSWSDTRQGRASACGRPKCMLLSSS